MTFGWSFAQMRMERDKRQVASVYKPPDDSDDSDDSDGNDDNWLLK